MKVKRTLYYKYKFLKLLPDFLNKFGILKGGALFTKLFVSIGVIHINVSQIAAPVAIRSHESDLIVFWELFVNDCYNIVLAREPQLILDGGANIGLSVVYFANRFPNAHIVAIEPDQGNLAILDENCKPYSNISIIETALWGNDGHLRIVNPQNSGWGFVVEKADSDDPDAFQAMTITSIMEGFDSPQIDLLKLDIEGAERSVFASHQMDWLNHVEHLVIELHDYEHKGCRTPVMNACATAQLDLASEHDHVCVFTRKDNQAIAVH